MLQLCRDVYHCTPVDLERIPLETILEHLTCLQVEAQARAAHLAALTA